MDIETEILNGMGSFETDIWSLLVESDNDFVPSLSSRESTTQKLFGQITSDLTPLRYFNQLKQQQFLIAKSNSEVVGFISFCSNRFLEDLPQWSGAEYISTIIVRKDMRGRKIAIRMYHAFFDHCKGKRIVTRTWSTNSAHLNILSSLGFKNILTIKDDRASGIDTVYYGRFSE